MTPTAFTFLRKFAVLTNFKSGSNVLIRILKAPNPTTQVPVLAGAWMQIRSTFTKRTQKIILKQFLTTIIGFHSQTFHNNYLCKLVKVALMLRSRAKFFKNTGNQLKDLLYVGMNLSLTLYLSNKNFENVK